MHFWKQNSVLNKPLSLNSNWPSEGQMLLFPWQHSWRYFELWPYTPAFCSEAVTNPKGQSKRGQERSNGNDFSLVTQSHHINLHQMHLSIIHPNQSSAPSRSKEGGMLHSVLQDRWKPLGSHREEQIWKSEIRKEDKTTTESNHLYLWTPIHSCSGPVLMY